MNKTPIRFSPPRILSFTLLAVTLALSIGCGSGGKEAKNQVTGKITIDGKPVGGSVVFLSAENKEFMSPISATDGLYQVIDVPSGTYKIFIRPMGGAPGGGKLIEPKGGTELPKMSTDTGTPAPQKYQSAATSGLTLEVKGGKQEHNIPLTP